MIAVKVTYKVNADFGEENNKNINAFLTDFKKMLASSFLYHVYVKEDGLTFVHLAMYESEEVQDEVLNTPSFVLFQKKRDESGLKELPIIEKMTHLGSSLSVLQ